MPIPKRHRLALTLLVMVPLLAWGMATLAVQKNQALFICRQIINVSGAAADGGATTLYYISPEFSARSQHGVSPTHYGGGEWCVNVSAGVMNNSAVTLQFVNVTGVPTSVQLYPVGYDESQTYLPANAVQVNGTTQTAGDIFTALSNTSTNVGAVKAKTDILPFVNVTGFGAGVYANVSTVSGNVTGSVNSVTTPVAVSGYVSLSAPVSVDAASIASVKQAVWNFALSGTSAGTGSAGDRLDNTSASGGLTAAGVWNYAAANASANTMGGVLAATSASGGLTAPAIWNYAADNASAGTMGGVLADTSASGGLTADGVWAHASASQINTNLINTSSLASAIKVKTDILPYVNVTAGTITSVTNPVTVTGFVNVSTVSGNVTGSVGSVATPVAVGGFVSLSAPVAMDAASIASVQQAVWNFALSGTSAGTGSAGDRLDNTSAGSGLTAAAIWNYATANASNATMGGTLADTSAGAGLTAQGVWEYAAGSAVSDTMGGLLGNTTASSGLTADQIWAHASAGQINTNLINTSSLASQIKVKTDLLPFVNVTGFSTAALAQFFNTSAGTYALSSAGSLVREIVANATAGGGGLTADQVWAHASAVNVNTYLLNTSTLASQIKVKTDLLPNVTAVVSDKTGFSLSTAGVGAVVNEIDSRHGPGPYTK